MWQFAKLMGVAKVGVALLGLRVGMWTVTAITMSKVGVARCKPATEPHPHCSCKNLNIYKSAPYLHICARYIYQTHKSGTDINLAHVYISGSDIFCRS